MKRWQCPIYVNLRRFVCTTTKVTCAFLLKETYRNYQELNTFKLRKTTISFTYWSDEGFMETVWNQALQSLHEESQVKLHFQSKLVRLSEAFPNYALILTLKQACFISISICKLVEIPKTRNCVISNFPEAWCIIFTAVTVAGSICHGLNVFLLTKKRQTKS